MCVAREREREREYTMCMHTYKHYGHINAIQGYMCRDTGERVNYVYAYVQAYGHTYAVHAYVCRDAGARVHIHACIHTCIHTCMHAYMQALKTNLTRFIVRGP